MTEKDVEVYQFKTFDDFDRLPNENNITPSHYDGDECMKAIEIATKDLRGGEAYCTGAVIKYLWRWKRKGGKEDLEKAKWYIDRMIGKGEVSGVD